MEELQSTEVLDREILDDARKKALRIIKQADDAVNSQNAQWEKKTEDSKKDLEKKYIEQIKNETVKVMAKLPIDKQRARIERIESCLKDSVESWYQNLKREKVLKILSREVSKRLCLCDEVKTSSGVKIEISGLDINEAEVLLKPFSINYAKPFNIIKSGTNHTYPFIMIESGSTRIIASVEKAVEFIIYKNREEIIESLVGRDLMEGV